jgi:uncharacterized protein (TIGR03086 family)
MNVGGTSTVVTGGVALLERAMSYTLGGLMLVTPDAMDNPTPCGDWDLRALLLHMNESLLTMHEAIAVGHLDHDRDFGDPALDPVASLRNRACEMIGAWANAHAPGDISIADRLLTPGIVAAAGAVEVTVHGWDVARACGQDRPVPRALAEELLDLCPLFVRDADRATRFAPRLELSPERDNPSDRLVAFLGRDPR